MQVAHFLIAQGFANVWNMTGGVHAWALQVDPSMPTY
jgi:rhodanese-related sulfurtransferase